MGDHDLHRFLEAQEPIYAEALAELRRGDKRGHWMWFIFPQLAGLGHSETSRYYGINGVAEAQTYAAHPVLGARLRECADAVLEHNNKSAQEIFGGIDAVKLRSSMTLFDVAAEGDDLYQEVLARFFDGQPDSLTLEMLKGAAN